MNELVVCLKYLHLQLPYDTPPNATPIGEDLEATEYRAIFPYQSDTEGDLEFGEGETVWVYWAQDNGWWYGAVGSVQGWFPGSFVEVRADKQLLSCGSYGNLAIQSQYIHPQ